MSNDLTATRLEVAQLLRDALGDMPVWSSPPSAPSPPCVILSMRGGALVSRGIISQTLRVTAVGPAGDNEAAVTALEDMVARSADALRPLAAPMSWEPIGSTMMAGQTCLAVTLDIVYEVNL